MKKFIAIGVAAVIFAATLWGWIYSSVNAASGNLFQGSTASQMVLYGRLCGLLTALIFLILMLSMGKGRTIEQFIEKKSLVKWHRRLGISVILLLIGHLILIFGSRSVMYYESFLSVLWQFFSDKSWGTLTFIGILLFMVIWICCVLFILKKMKFPVWKKTHYLVYLMVVILFFHQIFCGADFSSLAIYRFFWIGIFVVVMLDAVVWRIKLQLQNR